MNFADFIYKQMPYMIAWIKSLGHTPEDVWWINIDASKAQKGRKWKQREPEGNFTVTLFFYRWRCADQHLLIIAASYGRGLLS